MENYYNYDNLMMIITNSKTKKLRTKTIIFKNTGVRLVLNF